MSEMSLGSSQKKAILTFQKQNGLKPEPVNQPEMANLPPFKAFCFLVAATNSLGLPR
jgi:hypothetical protein